MGSRPDHSVQEQVVLEIGRDLYRRARRGRPALFDPRSLRGRVLSQAIRDNALRAALFQFVDVLPQLSDSGSIARHFQAYLRRHRLAGPWGRLLALGNYPVAAWAVKQSVARLARLFLVEETERALRRTLADLSRIPAGVTMDAVGEAVLTESEAEGYLQRNLRLLDWLAAGDGAPNLSLKLSALTPRFDPLDLPGLSETVLRRLAPLMHKAVAAGATVTLDMEHYEFKPAILALFRKWLEAWPQSGWLPGIALQAYLPETERDLVSLIRLAESSGRRISIRLVKGAYWDTEVALAKQRRWPVPVYRDKGQTDANYEHLARLLFQHAQWVYPAIATHNLRSLAFAMAAARHYEVHRDNWEVQMLHGMAEPLKQAVADLGVRLRIYLPSGELITGIAYLIRRLMENTADTSILRQAYLEAAGPEQLLAPPRPATEWVENEAEPGFANTPLTDFSRVGSREPFAAALRSVRGQLERRYGLAIAGAPRGETAVAPSLNPANPSEVLGEVDLAGAAQAEQAVRNAVAAFDSWRAMAVEERSTLCLRAAGIMLSRRAELAAWEILEVGKNWREADADVAEAIDYLRYYAGEMERLAGWLPTASFPAERNHLRYEPRGPAVIIAPWNFPLAILTGMATAALVAGNPVILKPAGPARIIAHQLHSILGEAGFPPEVCQLLPGEGALVGDLLVRHPAIHLIAFTGSREVGLRILEQAHARSPEQTHVKQVVCEMGGKNAIIVDEDADLDEAVIHILQSAFGYQGQKCSAASRLIAVGRVHDTLVSRLADALECHPLGPPEDPKFVLGPLINEAARRKAIHYLEIGKQEGKLFYQAKAPEQGYFFGPTIFTGIEPRHRLAREEIFAPILSVLRAPDFETALAIAMDSDYALTGGVFSRLPAHLEAARERFRVGDLYLNRKITGALVAVQPFGGVRLSGPGVQAGGPDYLKQFLWTRVVSENTLRHGFVP
ncbi:MAG: bifunctional proline dehydrogenase/L-glutamate gamma-semialdehyde dehydrogenase [Betaproteobacteria bacterium]|nr:bifunctional proline dehydrogenase/L-glutamate gamma-semialdehyde dehydrogenase [Betaproteobacteria bacterium]